MNEMSKQTDSGAPAIDARDWMKILSRYREPILWRSLFELAITLLPFMALWAAAYFSLSISFWLSLPFSIVAAGFLLRLFIIQHDCGHGAFFKSRTMNDWLGRAMGVLTQTPYDVWRHAHSMHHSHSGNLDKRGVGDMYILTVQEYKDASLKTKLHYRFVRSSFTMFIIAPVYIYLFENRLPVGYMRAGWKYWISTMGTNLVALIIAGTLISFIGFVPFLLVFLPTTLIAAAVGIWMFYVQHQFEATFWEHDEKWQLHDAALFGSSHYILPKPLAWLSGYIGIHHVHHLYSRIPFYRLPQVIKDHPALADIRRLTIRESLSCVKLHLWDENQRRLISYAEMRRA